MKVYRIGYPVDNEHKIYSKICYSPNEVWRKYVIMREWFDRPFGSAEDKQNYKDMLFNCLSNEDVNTHYLGNFIIECKELLEDENKEN